LKNLSGIFAAILFLTTAVKAQTAGDFFSESRMVIRSEDKFQKVFEATTDYSYITLNTSNGDFQIKTDAFKLSTGDQRLDSALQSKGNQYIIFKANLSDKLALFSQQIDDEKLYTMPGQLTINNLSVNCVAQFDPVNYSDNPETKNYRMDFLLALEPGKLVIAGLEGKINKQLFIEIKGGKLNMRQ
jgi:hypothetical protein